MTSGETATDRRIYQITGADALPFLQGLTSNDVLPLAKAPGIVWTALLTPQGKYLADFFVANTGETLLLDIKDSLGRVGGEGNKTIITIGVSVFGIVLTALLGLIVHLILK
jgi:hypothetical protein